MYIAPMFAARPDADGPRALIARILPLIIIIGLAAAVYAAFGRGMISLQELVAHREAIDAFVNAHLILAVLAYIGLYVAAVILSLPGASFLTAAGGLLFGLVLGASAAVIGATLGATVIFLVARTALGEPLLRRAGPRVLRLAQEFREDAFSYLLFLRLVPAFPFFLVNLVPAFADMRLAPFIAATLLGVIPGALAYALAGMGLDSIIVAQQHAVQTCLAAGGGDCHLIFDAKDILTPELIGAFIVLGLLALVPVAVRHIRHRAHAAM